MKRRRRAANSWEWHEAQMAEGPQGYIKSRASVIGSNASLTWDDLHCIMIGLMFHWEAMPPVIRSGYAFPNPEDRRQAQ